MSPAVPAADGLALKDVDPGSAGRSYLLKLTMLATLTMPSYMVLDFIGASGNVAHLLALMAFALWFTLSAFGLHDPRPWGHPGRMALTIWIGVSMVSYASMSAGLSGFIEPTGRAAADRWILLLLAGAGITLMTTESIRSMDRFRELVRWVMTGAAFCSAVAIIQFQFNVNPMEWIESVLIGFSDNGSAAAFQARDGFLRVSGSTSHPIELAVISSMLLPLSIWWAMFDPLPALFFRVVIPALLFLTNVLTISRTGLIGLAVCALVVIPFLPRVARRWALLIVPAAAVAIFLTIPGMVGTLFGSATAGANDSSITFRTDDYPLAWRLFFVRPWLGQGPGTWMPEELKLVFDNQYLFTVVTLGGIGLVALLAYFLLPAVAALAAARAAPSDELRLLGGAVAAALLTAAVAAGTFDAFSFQTYTLVVSFFVGVSGTVWITVRGVLRSPAGSPLRVHGPTTGG